MGHPIPGMTPQLGTPKSPWIQKPNWPDWKNTPITLWLFWHLPTEVTGSKVRFTQPLLNKMYPDLPLLWKPWPCLKIRFWFHGNLSLYSVCSKNSGRIPTGEENVNKKSTSDSTNIWGGLSASVNCFLYNICVCASNPTSPKDTAQSGWVPYQKRNGKNNF